MKFWRIDSPRLGDYQRAYVNGKLDHPFRMPRAHCAGCNSDLWDMKSVVPYPCPEAFQTSELLVNHETQLSLEAFEKLKREIIRDLKANGFKSPKIRPGDCLQPAYLDIPSVPAVDFLWSSLWSGLSTVLVSERVKSLMETVPDLKVEFAPAILRNVGQSTSRKAPRIPHSGEPEDLMNFRKTAAPGKCGTYYQIFFSECTAAPPGIELDPVCKLCGEPLVDWKVENSHSRRRAAAEKEAWKTLTQDQLASMWTGDHLFTFSRTGIILVTDTLKQVLENAGATNVEFHAYPSAPSELSQTRKRVPKIASGNR